MRKLKFYIDTSVWGFLFEDEAIEKRAITERLFERIKEGEFEFFISALVIEEIRRIGDKKLREDLLQVISLYKPIVLGYSREIEELAEELVEMRAIPEDYIDDARHIAYAIFYELDGILSWNMRHIVKFNTRRVVAALCHLKGYKEIEILSPEEVIYER